MDTLSLEAAYRLAKLNGDVHQLFALDDAWTRFLAEGRTLNPEDVKLLNSIVSDMDRLLAETQELLSAELAKMVEAGTLTLIENVRTICKQRDLPSDQIDRIVSQFEELGGNASALATVKDNLERQVPIERKELLCKIAIINSGLYTSGDMSRIATCLTGMACVAAGLGAEATGRSGAGLIDFGLGLMGAC